MVNTQKLTGLLALASPSIAFLGPVEQRDAPVTPAPAAHPPIPACPSCHTYTETKPFLKKREVPSIERLPTAPFVHYHIDLDRRSSVREGVSCYANGRGDCAFFVSNVRYWL
ncbi:hypothetical protein BJ875DRAFT_445706 [Amylocarpus encephaloides]|uniref:Uncharacterized protein n=1 Tax=Amylocarpus encephaloides TaxID=45428 RepID=A0A9P7Y9P2_9HELO|nr:hypothetical protein BJ875DRAFT_445706 [Amylocarpus encephaloides]